MRDDSVRETTSLQLASTVVWYGRGNRIRRFSLPAGAPFCRPELRAALGLFLATADQVVGRSPAP